MYFVAGILTTFAGIAWLILSLPAQWRQVHACRQLTPYAMLTLRMLGALALPLSLALFRQGGHISLATLIWVLVIATTASFVRAILSWRPGWLAPLTGSLPPPSK